MVGWSVLDLKRLTADRASMVWNSSGSHEILADRAFGE